MSQLIPLLIAYFPKLVFVTQLLSKIPDAIDTGKELKAFIDKVMAILNRPGMLTVEQRKALDEEIDKLKADPDWQLQK